MNVTNCPVCNHISEGNSYCKHCSWDLSENVFWLGAPEIPERQLQERLELARKNWNLIQLVERHQNTNKIFAQTFRSVLSELNKFKK